MPEEYDEESGFLTEELTEKGLQYEKSRAQVLIAYSNLRSVSIAILLCLALFVSMITARLELDHKLRWPIYIDFMPLFLLPWLIYIAAVDFAATRMSTNATLGKVVAVVVGVLSSFGVFLLAVLVCLRLTNTIPWRWTSVLFPFWCGLLISQFLFCFLIPGFLRNNMLHLFYGAFLMMWMTGFSVLLAGLKLDGELPGVHWWMLLMPVWAVLLGQVALMEKKMVDVAMRSILLVCAILLPLRLESIISLPWAVVLLPPVLVLVMGIVEIYQGTDPDPLL